LSSQTSNDAAVTALTAKLVQRAAIGDELAWRRLIDQFGPLLCQISSTYRLGEAEAADAFATAWFKLVEHIGSLRDGCAVQGWLVTTLRRECLARARARSRERPVADFAGTDEPVHIVDFDRSLTDADRRRMVHRALMELIGTAASADRNARRRPGSFVCGDKHQPGDADRQHRSHTLQGARQSSARPIRGGAGAGPRRLNSMPAHLLPVMTAGAFVSSRRFLS
jgi:DNA-directed RNA polymerase specialized sigma24 family protein